MGWNNVPPNGFPQIPDIEDLEAVVNDVAGLKTIKANKADIAPEFSATSNYAVGDLVYYEGTLYKCTTAHEAAAWNAEHFTETTLEAEIAELQGDVSDLGTTKANQITIATTFSSETAYDPGDLVYYNGLTYRCTNSHEGAWDAADFAATTIAGELSELNSKITGVTPHLIQVQITGTLAANESANVNIPTADLPFSSKILGLSAVKGDNSVNTVMVGNLVRSSSQFVIHVHNCYNDSVTYSYTLNIYTLP